MKFFFKEANRLISIARNADDKKAITTYNHLIESFSQEMLSNPEMSPMNLERCYEYIAYCYYMISYIFSSLSKLPETLVYRQQAVFYFKQANRFNQDGEIYAITFWGLLKLCHQLKEWKTIASLIGELSPILKIVELGYYDSIQKIFTMALKKTGQYEKQTEVLKPLCDFYNTQAWNESDQAISSIALKIAITLMVLNHKDKALTWFDHASRLKKQHTETHCTAASSISASSQKRRAPVLRQPSLSRDTKNVAKKRNLVIELSFLVLKELPKKTPLELSNLYFKDKGDFVEIDDERYFIRPGALELLRYLFNCQENFAISFCSSNNTTQAGPILNELLNQSLEPNEACRITSRTDLLQQNKRGEYSSHKFLELDLSSNDSGGKEQTPLIIGTVSEYFIHRSFHYYLMGVARSNNQIAIMNAPFLLASLIRKLSTEDIVDFSQNMLWTPFNMVDNPSSHSALYFHCNGMRNVGFIPNSNIQALCAMGKKLLSFEKRDPVLEEDPKLRLTALLTNCLHRNATDNELVCLYHEIKIELFCEIFLGVKNNTEQDSEEGSVNSRIIDLIQLLDRYEGLINFNLDMCNEFILRIFSNSINRDDILIRLMIMEIFRAYSSAPTRNLLFLMAQSRELSQYGTIIIESCKAVNKLIAENSSDKERRLIGFDYIAFTPLTMAAKNGNYSGFKILLESREEFSGECQQHFEREFRAAIKYSANNPNDEEALKLISFMLSELNPNLEEMATSLIKIAMEHKAQEVIILLLASGANAPKDMLKIATEQGLDKVVGFCEPGSARKASIRVSKETKLTRQTDANRYSLFAEANSAGMNKGEFDSSCAASLSESTLDAKHNTF